MPASCLVAQPPPAAHARTTVHLLWQHAPRDPASQNEQDALEASAIRQAWSSALRFWCWGRKKRFDQIPQGVGKKRRGHESSVRVNRDVLTYHAGCDRKGFVTASYPWSLVSYFRFAENTWKLSTKQDIARPATHPGSVVASLQSEQTPTLGNRPCTHTTASPR
jgi:hypothetical protein